MNDKILLPVYCKGGSEYFYDTTKGWGMEFKPLSGYDRPIPEIVKNFGSFSIELSKSDLEKLNEKKSFLHQRLLPILENHGLGFSYYMGTGPNENPNNVFVGMFRWVLFEKKYERVLTRNRNKTLFQIEGDARRMIFHDKNQVMEGNYTIFKIRMRATSHHEHMKIPSRGIGAEFFLEELFTVLEKDYFASSSFPSWRERLDWFCGMINKHQHVILKPLPASIIEEVFDSIRSRAIRV